MKRATGSGVSRVKQEELQHVFSPWVKVRGMLTLFDKPLPTVGCSRVICRGVYDQGSKGLWVGFSSSPHVQWWCLAQATRFKLIPGHFFELLVTEMLKTQHKSLQLIDPLPLCQITYKLSCSPQHLCAEVFPSQEARPFTQNSGPLGFGAEGDFCQCSGQNDHVKPRAQKYCDNI